MTYRSSIYPHIQRIAATGESLPANGHAICAGLVYGGLWDDEPDAIIGKRHTRQHELDSGALKIVTVDDLHDGAEMLERHGMSSMLGSLTIRVEAERSYKSGKVKHPKQGIMLAYNFLGEDDMFVVYGGTLPFDDTMEQDIRTTWAEWGLELCYQDPEKRDQLAPVPLAHFTEAVVARLADIA